MVVVEGLDADLVLGSYLHNRYVPGWPLVDGRIVPDLSDRYLTIHYLHRFLAGVGLVYVVWLALAVRRRGRGRIEVALVDVALACYVVNVVLGLIHVVTKVTSSLVVSAHLLVAALAWAALVAVTTEARRHNLEISAMDAEYSVARGRAHRRTAGRPVTRPEGQATRRIRPTTRR